MGQVTVLVTDEIGRGLSPVTCQLFLVCPIPQGTGPQCCAHSNVPCDQKISASDGTTSLDAHLFAPTCALGNYGYYIVFTYQGASQTSALDYLDDFCGGHVSYVFQTGGGGPGPENVTIAVLDKTSGQSVVGGQTLRANPGDIIVVTGTVTPAPSICTCCPTNKCVNIVVTPMGGPVGSLGEVGLNFSGGSASYLYGPVGIPTQAMTFTMKGTYEPTGDSSAPITVIIGATICPTGCTGTPPSCVCPQQRYACIGSQCSPSSSGPYSDPSCGGTCSSYSCTPTNCFPPNTCINNVCTPPVGGCTSDSNCPSGQHCLNGQCGSCVQNSFFIPGVNQCVQWYYLAAAGILAAYLILNR